MARACWQGRGRSGGFAGGATRDERTTRFAFRRLSGGTFWDAGPLQMSEREQQHQNLLVVSGPSKSTRDAGSVLASSRSRRFPQQAGHDDERRDAACDQYCMGGLLGSETLYRQSFPRLLPTPCSYVRLLYHISSPWGRVLRQPRTWKLLIFFQLIVRQNTIILHPIS